MDENQLPHISAPDAQQALTERAEEVVLLDCREAMELRIASLENALHIPMGETPGRLQEIPRDKDVIVFCHSGVRSQTVTAFLREEGFERAMNMLGGIDAWSLQVDPNVPRY